MAGASIFSIIIGKLRHEKKLCLIILLKTDKNLEVDFHYTILLFGLIICLYVKDSGESPLDIKEIA